MTEIWGWLSGGKLRAANKAYLDAVAQKRTEFASLSYPDFRKHVQDDAGLEALRNIQLRSKLGTYAIYAAAFVILLIFLHR